MLLYSCITEIIHGTYPVPTTDIGGLVLLHTYYIYTVFAGKIFSWSTSAKTVKTTLTHAVNENSSNFTKISLPILVVLPATCS